MSEFEMGIDDIIDAERLANHLACDIEERLTSLTLSVNHFLDGRWVSVAARAFVQD